MKRRVTVGLGVVLLLACAATLELRESGVHPGPEQDRVGAGANQGDAATGQAARDGDVTIESAEDGPEIYDEVLPSDSEDSHYVIDTDGCMKWGQERCARRDEAGHVCSTRQPNSHQQAVPDQ